MANCQKCGSKRVTRRRAGVFVCQHCGILPGIDSLDRAGLSSPPRKRPSVAVDISPAASNGFRPEPANKDTPSAKALENMRNNYPRPVPAFIRFLRKGQTQQLTKGVRS